MERIKGTDWERIREQADRHFGTDTTPQPDRATPDTTPSLKPTLRKLSPDSELTMTPTVDACPSCNGAGWFILAVELNDPRFGKLQPCECQAGRTPPRTVAELARLRGELGRYAGATFGTFYTAPGNRKLAPVDWNGRPISETEQRVILRTALEAARSYAESLDGWLYLYGSFGAGKSHLAAAVLNAAAERGIVGCYVSVPTAIDFVHDGYSDHSATSRLDALKDVPLLVLDDFGAEYMRVGGAAEATLFKLVNARDVGDKATVITSNIHPDAAPGRIASRIAGRAALVWLAASDFRRAPGGL